MRFPRKITALTAPGNSSSISRTTTWATSQIETGLIQRNRTWKDANRWPHRSIRTLRIELLRQFSRRESRSQHLHELVPGSLAQTVEGSGASRTTFLLDKLQEDRRQLNRVNSNFQQSIGKQVKKVRPESHGAPPLGPGAVYSINTDFRFSLNPLMVNLPDGWIPHDLFVNVAS